MHIAIDLDGTLVNWGKRWDELLDSNYPDHLAIPRAAHQRSFNLRAGLSKEDAGIVDEIFCAESFYKELEPMPGAVEAVHEMLDAGHHVQIASSPWWSNPTCLQDKSDDIKKIFGADIQKRTIFTSDKTVIRADILIDDKPEITGYYEPVWSQILYDQPYNQDVMLPRITNWLQWEDAVHVHTALTNLGHL